MSTSGSQKQPKYTIEGDTIVMRFKISPRKSTTNKSMLLATTSGAEVFTHDGMDIMMNVNVYVPIGQWEDKTKRKK